MTAENAARVYGRRWGRPLRAGLQTIAERIVADDPN